MSNDNSKITNLEVDDPIELDSKYRMDPHDRRYIDQQALGVQTHLVDSLLSGYTATWGTMDSLSSDVIVGDCLCIKGNFVTKADTAALLDAGSLAGICLLPSSANQKVRYAIAGTMDASITGLDIGSSQPVRVNTTTARIERVVSYLTSDYPAGIADIDGNVTLSIGSTPIAVSSGPTPETGVAVGDITAGDIVTPANLLDPTKITTATRTARVNSSTVKGVALRTVLSGDTVQYAGAGDVIAASGLPLGVGTATWVIADDTGQMVRKQSLSGGEDVIGKCDTLGNLIVQPFRSSSAVPVVNVLNYGVTGNIEDYAGSNDPDPLIQRALSDAQASGNGGPAVLLFPRANSNLTTSAVYNITHPLRITKDFFRLIGGGRYSTILRTSFYGPAIIRGAVLSIPTTSPIVPPHAGNSAGQSWKLDGLYTGFNGPGHCTINLSHLGVLSSLLNPLQFPVLPGVDHFTLEFFYRHDDVVTGADQRAIISSSGILQKSAGSPRSTCFSLMVSGSLINGQDNQIYAEFTTVNDGHQQIIDTGGGVAGEGDSGGMTVGHTYHIALTYDGSTVRLYRTNITNPTGVLVGSRAMSGAMKQDFFEGVIVGTLPIGYCGDDYTFFPAPGTIDGIRFSKIARYAGASGSFATPTTKWDSVGDINMLYTCNFDNIFRGSDPPIASIVSSTFANPIEITTDIPHGLITNGTVAISGHLVNTAANGNWQIIKTSPTSFTLTNSIGNGTGVATGSAYMGGDVIQGYSNGTVGFLPTFSPVNTRTLPNGSLDITVDGFSVSSGYGYGIASGIYSRTCVASTLKNFGGSGLWIMNLAENNNFQSEVDGLFGSCSMVSPYATADVGAGNNNYYRNINTQGGACGMMLNGGSPVRVENSYISLWGPGYALIAQNALLKMDSVTLTSEARLSTCLGALSVGAQFSATQAHGCIFDATWLTTDGIKHGSTPINICDGDGHAFYGCSLSGGRGTLESVHVESNSNSPVIFDNCPVYNPYRNDIPVSLTPELVVARGGSTHQQSGGHTQWVNKTTHSTQTSRQEIGSAHTTTATPLLATFASSGSKNIPLVDNANTKIFADVTANGATWSWTLTGMQKMYKSASGVVTASTGVGGATDSTGTPPGGIDASFIETDPAAAPTVSLVAAAGNIDAGTHQYCYTYVDPSGESMASSLSSIITSVPANHGQVNLSVITVGPTGTTARNIYRTLAGQPLAWYLLHTIADNTTTIYTDNTPDIGLGAQGPASGSAFGIKVTGAAETIEWGVQTLATVIK